MSSASARVKTLQSKIASLKVDTQKAKSVVKALQAEQVSLKKDISTLQEENKKLKAIKVSADASDKKEIDKQVEEHKKAIVQLKTELDATKKAETISKEGVKRVEQHKKDAENALKTILKEIETLSTEVDGIHGIIKDILKTPPVYKGSKPPSPPSAPKTVKKTVPSRPTPVMPKKSVSTRPKMVTPTGKTLGGAKMVGGMRKYGKKY